MKKNILAALISGLSVQLLCTSAFAAAVSEEEINDSTSQAQEISTSFGSARIQAMMGEPGQSIHNDLDYYKVKAQAGDVLTLNIDNGYKEDAPLNSVLAVYGPAPEFKLLRMIDYAELDEGSNSILDARIDDLVVPETGMYTVAVSTVPRYFIDGGSTYQDRRSRGETVVTDYTLSIEGVSSGVKKVGIEVKPGSDDVAPINPRSRGKIPVAILGAHNFSVVNIDKRSLTFGANGDEASLHKCSNNAKDVNGDGQYDMVCHFNTADTGFNANSLEGVLKGSMKGSKEPFEGRAFLKVVPGSVRQ